MSRKVLVGCLVLVLIGLTQFPSQVQADHAVYHPAEVAVEVTVNSATSVTWEDVPIVHICVVGRGRPEQPGDVCNRPFKVNWKVTINDASADKLCGADQADCLVWRIPKEPSTDNGKMFRATGMRQGSNTAAPNVQTNYNALKLLFKYNLQVKKTDVNETPIGDPLDPDVMPHRPGG